MDRLLRDGVDLLWCKQDGNVFLRRSCGTDHHRYRCGIDMTGYIHSDDEAVLAQGIVKHLHRTAQSGHELVNRLIERG